LEEQKNLLCKWIEKDLLLFHKTENFEANRIAAGCRKFCRRLIKTGKNLIKPQTCLPIKGHAFGVRFAKKDRLI